MSKKIRQILSKNISIPSDQYMSQGAKMFQYPDFVYCCSISPLQHCQHDYKQDSRVFYMFIPNKSFGQLLDISHKHFIF